MAWYTDHIKHYKHSGRIPYLVFIGPQKWSGHCETIYFAQSKQQMDEFVQSYFLTPRIHGEWEDEPHAYSVSEVRRLSYNQVWDFCRQWKNTCLSALANEVKGRVA